MTAQPYQQLLIRCLESDLQTFVLCRCLCMKLAMGVCFLKCLLYWSVSDADARPRIPELLQLISLIAI
jgi:hypothetical protein